MLIGGYYCNVSSKSRLEDVDLVDLAKDRDKWPALVKTVISLLVA